MLDRKRHPGVNLEADTNATVSLEGSLPAIKETGVSLMLEIVRTIPTFEHNRVLSRPIALTPDQWRRTAGANWQTRAA